jgi:hypothetical protein
MVSDMNTPPPIPGRKVPSTAGVMAFLPEPLPPELAWTPQLVNALSDADRAIGRLAGEGGRLPNPHLLMRPFVAREAVLSSRIEGTQTTLGELLAAEAGAAVDRSPEDLREVGNYVVALEHGMARLKELPLCLRIVREMHEKLMAGVQGGQARPGEFRRFKTGLAVLAARPPRPATFHRRPRKSRPAWRTGKSFCTTAPCRRWRRRRWRITSSRPSIRFTMAMAAWDGCSSRCS